MIQSILEQPRLADAGFLVRRVEFHGHWSWKAEIGTGYGVAVVERGGRTALVAGAFPPSLVTRLEEQLVVTEPSELLRSIWDGMVAHCAVTIVDPDNDMAITAVDPFAIAKVYWFENAGRWVIGTVLPEVLRAVSATPLPLHNEACGHFLLSGYTPAVHTFYDAVRKVPPASMLIVDHGRRTEVAYFQPAAHPSLSGSAYLSLAREALDASLSGWIAEAPVTEVALSGGIDSTTLLAAALARAGRGRCRPRVIVPMGASGTVLNPDDRSYAQRVADWYGVKLEEASFRWDDEGLAAHFSATASLLGTESSFGALQMGALARGERETGTVLLAGQNADSLFSFALIGRPSSSARPPFIRGLGGWVAREGLMNGFDSGVPARIARALLVAHLRQRPDTSAEQLALGLAFDRLKFPMWPPPLAPSMLSNVDGLRAWFLKEYFQAPVVQELIESNPAAAFQWLFLQGYMQGSANRGTVWNLTLGGLPTLLPFATLDLLRLSMSYRPSFAFRWNGKYPIRSMATRWYEVPDWVVRRQDRPRPDLDGLGPSTFFANESVRDLATRAVDAGADRWSSFLDHGFLETLVDRVHSGKLRPDDLGILSRLMWLHAVEEDAWGDARRHASTP